MRRSPAPPGVVVALAPTLAPADVDPAQRIRQLAAYLAPRTAIVVTAEQTGERLLGLQNPVTDEIVTDELRRLIAEGRVLERRARDLAAARDADARRAVLARVERSLAGVLRSRPHVVDTLWSLVAATVPLPATAAEGQGPARRGSRIGRHLAAALGLTAAIAATIVVAVWAADRRFGALTVVEATAVWGLAFTPGWLYIRFIGQRAGALWDEYVLNLHRLGLDRPEYLPQPPVSSVYFAPWFAGGGVMMSGHSNIYRQKFDAYYGRGVSAATADARVKTGTFFPVVLATVVFAVGWTSLFWDDSFFTTGPSSVSDMLLFGFLGAYVFNLQMLSRRFFQSDLKPSAYTSAAIRVVVVLILVTVLHQLPAFSDSTASQEAVVAFVVGMFPLVGLQALNRLVAVVLRSALPSLRAAYPLSDLDGLNMWYEARLLEEGIEDMQNLVSANTVEVLLHTRVPVGRLVDWYDQAQLYLHLRPRSTSWSQRRREDKERRVHPRAALAAFGVRSATSLLTTFPPDGLNERGEPADPVAVRAYRAVAEQADGLSADAILTIARVLDAEPAIDPIKRWRHWESTARPSAEPSGAAAARSARTLRTVDASA